MNNSIVTVQTTVDNAIQTMKREKIINLLYELIRVKIDHLRVESNYEKKEKIQENILELIDKISDV